jgi:hypothetical protein
MLCPLLYSAGWGQALSDYPLLQCRCRSRARASLRNRLPGFFVFLPLLLFQAGALVILRNVKNTGFYGVNARDFAAQVCSWHLADIGLRAAHVRFRG